MSKIRILPENLSNQIAAGEVVERPASVIKELVENSIDAGSSRICVEIEKGGRQLMRVYDDGEGMTHDDALLCIERYATSKIRESKDLFSIGTLGFRGEAVPSIASVSHFTVLTKSRDEETGTLISVKGGKLVDVKETGAPDGTDITVSHLFFNTPARRKFLKAMATEMGHISETLACLALGSPNIYFKLEHNAKVVKEWPGGKLEDRVVEVLGRDFKNSIYEVNASNGDVKVTGFAGSPDITRSSSGKIYIFVNGRYIKDRSVIYSVYDGYEGRIMKGRYPGCVLFIDLPYDQVDVNVHPTKHEVRFSDHRLVMACVKLGVQNALKQEDNAKWNLKISDPVKVSANDFFAEKEIKPPAVKNSFSSSGFGSLGYKSPGFKQEPKPYTDNGFGNTAFSQEKKPLFVEELNTEPDFSENCEQDDITAVNLSYTEKKDSNIEKGFYQQSFLDDNETYNTFYSNLSIIGQLRNTYILCESKEGLILVDQHAAHERVRYEHLLNGYENSKCASQQLLMPQVIEPGHREAGKLLEMLDEFKKFGLEISHYGGNSFAVQAVPVILGNVDFKPIILDLASMISDLPPSYEISKAISDAIALMACHSAIRAKQSLDIRQINALFKELDKCNNPSRCPHGRPIWINIDWKFIEKSFKRIV